MSKRALTRKSAIEKLESIHRRMADVTEEEVFVALEAEERTETAVTGGAAKAITIICVASEGKAICESASTQTA